MRNKKYVLPLQLCLIALLAIGQGCNRFREPVYVPTSRAEVQEFGRLFEEAFKDKSREFFEARCDHRRLGWRATKEEFTGKKLNDFTDGVRKGFNMPKYFMGELETGNFENLYVLGPIQRGDDWVLRIRMSTMTGETLYEDLLLEKRTDEVDSRVVITDLFFFMSGEWVSKTVWENMQTAGVNINDIKPDDAALERLKRINKASRLYRDGEVEAGDAERDAMLPDLANAKVLLVTRLYALMEYDSLQFEEALAEFKSLYPEDEASILIEIYGGFAYGRIDRLENAISSMKTSLGAEDGYQYYLRSNLRIMQERDEEALEDALKAVEMEPEAMIFHEQLLNTYMLTGNFEMAVKELRTTMANEYYTDIELGYGSPEFYASEPFLKLREEDPENWRFLDEEDDMPFGPDEWDEMQAD